MAFSWCSLAFFLTWFTFVQTESLILIQKSITMEDTVNSSNTGSRVHMFKNVGKDAEVTILKLLVLMGDEICFLIRLNLQIFFYTTAVGEKLFLISVVLESYMLLIYHIFCAFIKVDYFKIIFTWKVNLPYVYRVTWP